MGLSVSASNVEQVVASLYPGGIEGKSLAQGVMIREIYRAIKGSR